MFKHKDLPMVIVGDVHGEWKLLQDKMKIYDLENTIIFQTGDFGVGFAYNNPVEPKKENKRISQLNAFLKKRKLFLYVIRGNHDNPLFFDGAHNFSNVIFLQDYDVVEIGEHKVLGIGGATSVDRKPNVLFPDYRGRMWLGRKVGVNWWENEKVVYLPEKTVELKGVDMVVSHTAPDFVEPVTKGSEVSKWCKYDETLEYELLEERYIMTKIYKELIKNNFIKYWCFGHFHQTKNQTYENTTFYLIDISEFREIKF